MNLKPVYIKCIFFICFFSNSKVSHCQDTTLHVTFDTAFLFSLGLMQRVYCSSASYIYHDADKKDKQNFNKYKYLIDQKPTSKNYKQYYDLACSLWDLEKTVEAEKMFLTITNSKDKFYSSTYYHSSDVPGDKTTNVYGYGSFTSNYKNYAAVYLTKLYIEQKKFDTALRYLDDAVNKYKVSYSCGTGYHWQKNEYDFLYASCYEGLNRNQEAVDMLLPECLQQDNYIIVSVLKKMYSKKEITERLLAAENSIVCSPDTVASYGSETTYGKNNKARKRKVKYYSGTATITLFDKEIQMPAAYLEGNKPVTKKYFIEQFKESSFYTMLMDDEGYL